MGSQANKTGVWVSNEIPEAAAEVAHIPSIKDAFDLFLKTVASKSADSNDVDQSNRYDADQIGAKRRKVLSV